jgi:hypothetical protein
MLEWIRKQEEGPGRPMSDPASAASLLSELRNAKPDTALNELDGWLESINTDSDDDLKSKSEILALIESAGAPHVTSLLAEYIDSRRGGHSAHDPVWQTAFNYVTRLAEVLGESARRLLGRVQSGDPTLQALSAAAAARSLRACRLLAKLHLVHYRRAPKTLWRTAYALHAGAEKLGCAATPVALHSKHTTATSATHELLRLLMLQMSVPEMLAPEQIEVADRVIEQIGQDFILRPRGIADNPFCFDPGNNLMPERSRGAQPSESAATRFFGPGMAFDALEHVYKQLLTARLADIKVYGRDIAPQVQVATVQHLLMFWRVNCPYSPPEHTHAAGSLQVIHRYGQIWQHLFRAHSGEGGLSLQADGDENPDPPETWALRDAGGNELGAEIPPSSKGWAKCGELVGVSLGHNGACWLGIIRRMHADSDAGLHADIAVMSRGPLAVALRALLARGEESVFSEASSRQFAFNGVRAIILADGSHESQKPNLLLPAESWKEGRVYEAMIGETSRHLRGVQLLRLGEDYVRATFEWIAAPRRG